MIGHIREEELVLYAGRDLPLQESSALAAHLEICSQCKRALAEVYEAQSFIRVSLQNPTETELAEVRDRFAARLQTQMNRSEKRWAWWAAGAAAALTLFTVPYSFEHKPVVTEKAKPATVPSLLAESINPGPSLQIPLTRVAAPRPRCLRLQKAGVRSVTLIAQENREPIIKMITADPNVVILWQSNERTEQVP